TGQPTAPKQLELGLVPAEARWKLPSESCLTRKVAKPIDRKLVEKGGETLEATLLEFGVDAHLVGMTIGPTVTRYELELGPGVKVNKVTSLSHDIAYAMASPDVRIIAPIPGRSAIGVEVPNRQRQLVNLGDILVPEEGAKPGQMHPLEVGLGRDIREMELRYGLLAEVGVRDVRGYNAAFGRGDLARDPLDGGTQYGRLPFIVVVVDELADLMMVAARDVETSICRIAQMARV